MIPAIMDAEVVVGEPGVLAARFAERFAAAADRAVGERGRFACCVPGGSAAEALLPALVGAPVDWPRVEVFFADERAVPPDHPDSNYGLARRLWLDRVPLDPARVHRMRGEDADLEAAADAYACDFGRTLGGRPLDLALLGVGHDGHVGSLFPGHPLLDEPRRTVAALTDSPKPPPRRLTLTLVALAGTALVCVAAFGVEKADAVRAALESTPSRLPVALAARGARRTLFLLDPAAASMLG